MQAEPLGSARRARGGRPRSLGGVDAGAVILSACTSEAYALAAQAAGRRRRRVLVARRRLPAVEHLGGCRGRCGARLPAALRRAWVIDVSRVVHAAGPRHPRAGGGEPRQPDRFATCDAAEALWPWGAVRRARVGAGHRRGVRRPRALPRSAHWPGPHLRARGPVEGRRAAAAEAAWTVVVGLPALADAALHRLDFIADSALSVSTPVQTGAAGSCWSGSPAFVLARSRPAAAPATAPTSLRTARLPDGWQLLGPEAGWVRGVARSRAPPEAEAGAGSARPARGRVHPATSTTSRRGPPGGVAAGAARGVPKRRGPAGGGPSLTRYGSAFPASSQRRLQAPPALRRGRGPRTSSGRSRASSSPGRLRARPSTAFGLDLPVLVPGGGEPIFLVGKIAVPSACF